MDQMKWPLFGDVLANRGYLRQTSGVSQREYDRNVWTNFLSTELCRLNKVFFFFFYESEQQNHSQVAH